MGEVRRPAELGRISLSCRPIDTGPAPVILINLRLRGQLIRVARLALYTKGPNGEGLIKTPYFLSGTIARQEDEGAFYFELHPHLGKNPPISASIGILKSEDDPLHLVRNRKPLESVGLSFKVSPLAQRVVLVVTTDGTSGFPKNLIAEIRNTPPEEQNGDDSPTMPLGTRLMCYPLNPIQKVNLLESLRASADQRLVVLGELFKATTLKVKMDQLTELVGKKPPVGIIEAGVRDVYFSGEEVAFDELNLKKTANQALAIFHPQTPIHILDFCLMYLLDEIKGMVPDALTLDLIRAAVLRYAQSPEGEKELSDLLEVIEIKKGKPHSAFIKQLMERAKERLKASAADTLPPGKIVHELLPVRDFTPLSALIE